MPVERPSGGAVTDQRTGLIQPGTWYIDLFGADPGNVFTPGHYSRVSISLSNGQVLSAVAPL